MYPDMSFISELGGGLGLFLGLSFLTIWDGFEVLLDKFESTRNYFISSSKNQ